MWRTLLPFSLKTNNRTIISQIFILRISFQFHPVSKTGGLLFLLLHFLCARSCFPGGGKGARQGFPFMPSSSSLSLGSKNTRKPRQRLQNSTVRTDSSFPYNTSHKMYSDMRKNGFSTGKICGGGKICI